MKRKLLMLCTLLCSITVCAQRTDRPRHVPTEGEVMYSGRIKQTMTLFMYEGNAELYDYLEKRSEWIKKHQKKKEKLRARIETEDSLKMARAVEKLNQFAEKDYGKPEPEGTIHPYLFMVYPSFSEPYGCAIDDVHIDIGNRKGCITYLRLEGRATKDAPFKKQPPVYAEKMEVDVSIADSLILLLKLANVSATYMDPIMIQLDGNTYYFKHESKVSRSHADRGSNLAALTKLFVNICNAVKETDHQQMNDLVPEINRMVCVYRKIIPPDVHIDDFWD